MSVFVGGPDFKSGPQIAPIFGRFLPIFGLFSVFSGKQRLVVFGRSESWSSDFGEIADSIVNSVLDFARPGKMYMNGNFDFFADFWSIFIPSALVLRSTHDLVGISPSRCRSLRSLDVRATTLLDSVVSLARTRLARFARSSALRALTHD